MSELPKPSSTTSLVLLGLVGAAAGFWLHASTQDPAAMDSQKVAAVEPATSVVPVLVQGQGGAAVSPIVLNVTMADGRVAAPVADATSVGAFTVPSPVVATPQPVTIVSSVSPSSNATSATNVVVQDYSISVDGSNVVIAKDGSIVQVGDNGDLDANTGDASGGGSIGVEVQDSNLQAGGSAPTHGGASAEIAASTTSTQSESPNALSAPDAATAPSDGPVTRPASVDPLAGPLDSFGAAGGVDVAGFEDHSLTVRGSRNIVTYDDSNVIINRDGKINMNTGDTDSSGLIAVDTVRSDVASGPHCDDGCDDESVISAQAGHFDNESDDDDEAEESDDDGESDDGDVSDPAETREEADSGSESPSVHVGGFVIGGDGFDDLGVRVDGDDNVVTYDDGNVIIGGSGDVNGQIGDSDTGGSIVIGSVDAVVRGGVSR